MLTVTGFSRSDSKSSYWNAICDCGNTHIAEKQNLRRGTVASCGCAVKKNGCKSFGKDNPLWNPLLTDEDRIAKRDTKENKDWRSYIFIRDDYKCVVCSAGGKINAHHINSYTFTPHMKYNKTNGITLCVKQHKDFHKSYGIKHNSGVQFLAYLDQIHYTYDVDDIEFV
jgi:hypothetical protein